MGSKTNLLYYPTVVFLFSLLDFSVLTSCFCITTFLLWQLNILNDCFLGGDEEIKTDNGLFLSISQKKNINGLEKWRMEINLLLL